MAHPLLTGKDKEKHLLLGNEAIARGAIEAGVGFVSCYPGTPSSEIPDTLFRLSPDADYVFEYSANEKVAMESGGGVTLTGVPALVTMKHVGLNVAADPFMTLAYIGTPGGMVIVSADDPGCHSSQNEQDNRYFARLGGIPVLEPLTAQEAKDMTKAAFELSARWQQPLMLRTTTRVNHLRGCVEFGGCKPVKKSGSFQKNPGRFVSVPAVSRARHNELLKNLKMIAAYSDECPWNRLSGEGEVGFIASGISRAYLHDALRERKQKARVLDLGFSWPLPEQKILTLLRAVKKLIIVEELEPIVEKEVRALAQQHGISVEIIGKGDLLPLQGEYSTQLLEKVVDSAFGMSTPQQKQIVPPPLPLRPPNLCAGCTHRSVYHSARHIFGDDVVYSSDIGCYTLGVLPPLRTVDFLLCMGSSISAGAGMSVVNDKPVIAFIGDSTFFHSGLTGLVNAVYNERNLLIVILDNRTTAMTGHQPNPGVDQTMTGPNSGRIDLATIVQGCGVCAEKIKRVRALNYKAVSNALIKLKDMTGVRVLIAQDPCPLFARRVLGQKSPRKAYVLPEFARDPQVVKISAGLGCPAFSILDGLVSIDEQQCTGCMLCVQLSPHIKARVKEKR